MKLRYLTLVAFGALLISISTLSAARAEAVKDVTAWAKQFSDVALKSDTAAMQEMIKHAADPRLPVAQLSGLFEIISKRSEGKKVIYVEQFENKELGNFFARRNFAVLLSDSMLYYSVTFLRREDGWHILSFFLHDNVNNVLTLAWPS